jgi:hypothetical protein
LLLTLLIAVLVFWIGVKAVRITTAARGLLGDLQDLQALDVQTLSSLDPANLTALRDRFASLEANLAAVATESAPFLPLAGGMGWLPRFGQEAQAAPALLDLASNVATAGRAALDGALPALAALRAEGAGQGSALARVLPALEASAPQWQEAEAALAAAATARKQIDPTTLDPRLGGQLQRLDEYLPLLQAGVGLAQLAPALLGADQSRTYLLLAQNSEELRATGGFISGVGRLTLDQGEIVGLDFQDSYAIYNPNVDHPPAPPDLERIMQAQMLLLRDANWSPDFPTTNLVAQSLYQLDTGEQVDGVIAFDLEATRRVVAALQPLDLPGYAEQVTADNLITALRAVWNAPSEAEGTAKERFESDWFLHRKDFMADLAAAARAKLEAGQVDFGVLVAALRSGLDEKHILVALNDPASMALLTGLGWDGALRPGDGDYLLVVDSNVGWNKVNVLVSRDTDYVVTPAPDGAAHGQLTLTYRHQGMATGAPCEHIPLYGDSYEDMAQRCYFNFVRVYTPAGARLIAVDGFAPESVTAFAGERGATVLAGYLVIPAGAERTVTFTYELPPGTLADSAAAYHLRVQKQPGTPAWPVQVTVRNGAVNWQPVEPPGQTTPRGAVFQFELRTDVDVVATAQLLTQAEAGAP